MVASVSFWPNSLMQGVEDWSSFPVWMRQIRACRYSSCFHVTQGMIGSSPFLLIGPSYPYLKLSVKGKVSSELVVVGQPWEAHF